MEFDCVVGVAALDAAGDGFEADADGGAGGLAVGGGSDGDAASNYALALGREH